MAEAVTEPLRRSPLDGRHRALGARMTAFGGWDMPLDYGTVVGEHRAVRERCGVFDLSHLGTLRVTGEGALAAVQRAFSNDAAVLDAGRAQYTLCLDEVGGIVDDLLLYRLPWGFFAVPNAANAGRVAAVLRTSAAEVGGADVADVKDDLACLAVQGPLAPDLASRAGLPVARMSYLDCRPLTGQAGEAGAGGAQVLARSGYTGERGFEAFVAAEQAPMLWDRLLESGVTPAGLGARDTLRLEMGYPLHGNDISPATSPVEAGLGWAVRAASEFVGRDAYVRAKEAGPSRRLRGLRALSRGVPRAHCMVSAGGEPAGETTSGTFSPTLRHGIALAYLDPGVALGDHVEVDVRGKAVAADVVRPPFVDANPRN
ncbi:MAG: glycine cleavage system aminomethyltransferase GcvT [Nitriliruptorales bacterium]|nr:glycine cleavage system aminomethyltransferase GcvT [Nitriliruptorales bacterium]